MTMPAPIITSPMAIEKDWIDYNGHLNMAYYNVLFDRGSDEAFEMMGMGPNYAKERRLTLYTAEVHVCYVQELHLDHKVKVLPCGHYSTGETPFKYIDGWHIGKFLKTSL